MKIRSLLPWLALLFLATGCLHRREVIPDHQVPHRISRATSLHLWVRGADGNFVEQETWIAPDQWILVHESLLRPTWNTGKED